MVDPPPPSIRYTVTIRLRIIKQSLNEVTLPSQTAAARPATGTKRFIALQRGRDVADSVARGVYDFFVFTLSSPTLLLPLERVEERRWCPSGRRLWPYLF